MKLPKSVYGTRYNSATELNTQVTFTQPSNGQAVDGTPLPETAVATTWANVAMWRGKQDDKKETIESIASYKIIIRYPQTWALDSGMNILVRGQRHIIDAFNDPDGNRVELHIFTYTVNDTVNK